MRTMLLRDRNHPSVVMWSIGNEIPMRDSPRGGELSANLSAFVRAIDPTRPVTSAVPIVTDDDDTFFAPLDVAGCDYSSHSTVQYSTVHCIVSHHSTVYCITKPQLHRYNYSPDRYASDHERFPDRIIVATESYPLQSLDYWNGVWDHSCVRERAPSPDPPSFLFVPWDHSCVRERPPSPAVLSFGFASFRLIACLSSAHARLARRRLPNNRQLQTHSLEGVSHSVSSFPNLPPPRVRARVVGLRSYVLGDFIWTAIDYYGESGLGSNGASFFSPRWSSYATVPHKFARRGGVTRIVARRAAFCLSRPQACTTRRRGRARARACRRRTTSRSAATSTSSATANRSRCSAPYSGTSRASSSPCTRRRPSRTTRRSAYGAGPTSSRGARCLWVVVVKRTRANVGAAERPRAVLRRRGLTTPLGRISRPTDALPSTVVSWTWPGHEGAALSVRVFTRLARVRLLVDGAPVDDAGEATDALTTVFRVPYAAGNLTAVAVDPATGEAVAASLLTTGAPAALKLTADREGLAADRSDLSYVTAEVVDAAGRRVPYAEVPRVPETQAERTRPIKIGWLHCKEFTAKSRHHVACRGRRRAGLERTRPVRIRSRSPLRAIAASRVEVDVAFSATGVGELSAVGSGNPNDPASARAGRRVTWLGRCVAILRPGAPGVPPSAGLISLTASAPGLASAIIDVYVA